MVLSRRFSSTMPTVMERTELNTQLPSMVDGIVQSIASEPRLHHLNRVVLPNRDQIILAIEKLRECVFAGYFGAQGLTRENLAYRIGQIVDDLQDILFIQVQCCLRYRQQIPGNTIETADCHRCDLEAADIVAAFLKRLPAVRDMLASDVQAAFDGDPAAHSTDETIFCYPGLFAIAVQRLSHEFYNLKVPLLPRIMTEHAHALTGIDIHPGAKLGKSFFIDHGSGVVIGETTTIGDNVKLYQGVTLGALSPAHGQLLRDHKRHPTIEDNVTIYANATILGGETIIGTNSTIGGNVFITSSVPANNIVTAEPPVLKYRQRGKKAERNDLLDFQI
jgi:serine O-acetyltransferase